MEGATHILTCRTAPALIRSVLYKPHNSYNEPYTQTFALTGCTHQKRTMSERKPNMAGKQGMKAKEAFMQANGEYVYRSSKKEAFRRQETSEKGR